MLSKDEIVNLFKEYLVYNPTKGQDELIDKLIQFLFYINQNSVFVLKGYAGTGKTSIVSALVKLLPVLKLRSVLLAPTGRAAKVLSVYSKKPAFTIHKKIYIARPAPDGSMHVVLQENKHKNTLFIIDEASMIPDQNSNQEFSSFAVRNLLEDVMDYIYNGENCRLLLVGDTAQLPPVGLDISPALDLEYLKASFSMHLFTYELTEVVRQSYDSGILANATFIREKIRHEKISLPLFILDKRKDIESITGTELEEALLDSYGNSGSENCIIITRSNKRAVLFNQEVRNRILYKEDELTAGDMLMVVKNNYYWLEDNSKAGFIANGDLIEVLSVKNFRELYGYRFAEIRFRMLDYPDQTEIEAKIILNTLTSNTASLSFEDERKFYNEVMQDYEDEKSRRKRIELVKNNPYYNALQVKFSYALTCHKTQGGQWGVVFIDQGFLKEDMIDKEYFRWLYTALTRSINKVYLVNFNEQYFIHKQEK